MDCAFALHATALVKDINIIRLLLDKGADPNAVTEDADETPLQRICTFCPAPEAVELLLKYGADPNLGGGRFGSPLQSTCQAYGSVETLKVLIKYGANVNQSCGGFGTALHAAAFYGDFEMVQYLVSQGADIHAKGYMYPSVVRCAMQNGHGQILVYLLKLGADMDTHGGRYGDTLQKLLATAPADEPELWFRTYAKANSVQMFVMIKKGATWQDFDNIVFYDRSVDGEHVDDSKWACILPPAVLTPIRPVRY
jgi:ankyrin repeat protein